MSRITEWTKRKSETRLWALLSGYAFTCHDRPIWSGSGYFLLERESEKIRAVLKSLSEYERNERTIRKPIIEA
jgi:hypothetical protein